MKAWLVGCEEVGGKQRAGAGNNEGELGFVCYKYHYIDTASIIVYIIIYMYVVGF